MFSWDDAKNESNQRKHSVSFEAAQLVFDDPLHITRQDRTENGSSGNHVYDEAAELEDAETEGQAQGKIELRECLHDWGRLE